ncbi:MAG TPA: GNAT family protein [Flavitalea sp.]|nr:GNAT family protein [Flavitalea sp.]
MIRLESFTEADYNLLISWVDNEEMLMQFAGPGFSYPLTHEQLKESQNNPKRIPFKVVDAGSDVTIGHAEIYIGDTTAYLGKILIGPVSQRGKGICQEIVRQLLELVFNNYHQVQVELNVFDWNTRAIHCYQKSGFRINAGKKAERNVNGRIWTVINMTIDHLQWKEKLCSS